MSSENSKLLFDDNGAPCDPINGFETEHGFACQLRGAAPRTVKACELYDDTFGPAEENDEYLADGSRAYIDARSPEYSTAEEVDYLRSAYRKLAGYVKMARRYRERLARLELEADLQLYANTCNAQGESWGSSHSNVLAPRALSTHEYCTALAVHSVSNCVWSGAGLVRPDRAREGAFQFALSERAEYIWRLEGSNAHSLRPLVHNREDPLADAQVYRRIHDITGDTVFSPRINALKQASIALLLRACGLGVQFEDLMPERPVRALRAISRDPTLTQKVRLREGGLFSGLELQLAAAERALNAAIDADSITPQQRKFGEYWIDLCDALKADPRSETCARQIDWITKMNFIDEALQGSRAAGDSDVSIALRVAQEYAGLLPEEGMGMQLIRSGYFADSPQVEVLENGLPLPPTRAQPRGAAIARLQMAGVPYRCDWMHMLFAVDGQESTIILADPYATENVRLEERLRALGA